jgi:NAD(P) transhydrogenase subunit alpha
MNTLLLLLIFIIATFAGFKVINQVPNLLHTPLMSGMNALSGVTILGALVTTSVAVRVGSQVLGFLAIVLASINVIGGFVVTDRMLKMFKAR